MGELAPLCKLPNLHHMEGVKNLHSEKNRAIQGCMLQEKHMGGKDEEKEERGSCSTSTQVLDKPDLSVLMPDGVSNVLSSSVVHSNVTCYNLEISGGGVKSSIGSVGGTASGSIEVLLECFVLVSASPM